MTDTVAKDKIRAMSKMDKTNRECFFTSDKKVQNHHVIAVWREAEFSVSHPAVPLDIIPKPTIPANEHMHKLVHQFQNDHGGRCKPSKNELVEMFIWKEQLHNQQRDIDHIFNNADFHDIQQEQIDNIDHNLANFGFDVTPEILQDYFIGRGVEIE